VLPAAVAALAGSTMSASALAPESAVINVDNVHTTVTLPCIPNCPADLAGGSSGDITGVDGTTAYEVAWPAAGTLPTGNLTGTMSITAVCGPNSPAVVGGRVTGGSFDIAGAVLVYGTSSYVVTVHGTFAGPYYADTLVPLVSSLTISGGPVTISLAPIEAAGAVQMTPLPPVAGCSGTQGFALSGTMLAAL
jgi:hypothetical protein